MYVITGITGKVGGMLARTLRATGQPVRAVMRNPEKSAEWEKLGCEIAIADMGDEHALEKAFRNADAVFILPPSNFDPRPGFPEATAEAKIIRATLERSNVGKVVCLSTVGGHAHQTNLLSQRTILEQELASLSMPLTILRPGWFFDNFAWDVASAAEGTLYSFLHPADKAFPMVSTKDVGRVAAELIQETWSGRRIVELVGPERTTPRQMAEIFSKLLQRPVELNLVPRDTWEELFRSQGMKNPIFRIQMLDGFNEGWIDFEGAPAMLVKGSVSAEEAIKGLLND
ncbi:NmrA family NAD(P)-binding protein [Rhizobium sp. No.120]